MSVTNKKGRLGYYGVLMDPWGGSVVRTLLSRGALLGIF